MDNSSKQNLVNEIENRLDDFFLGNEGADSADKDSLPLEKLKSVVLSIDWEITEGCLSDLINETNALLPQCKEDRLSHTLLRMLKAVGRYIRKHKAQAHPDAIKRVLSVFSSLEKLTGGPAVDEKVKKQIVAKEIAAFKKLKEQIETQRGVAANQPPAQAANNQNFIDNVKFEKAMGAVEKRLNSQVESLKAQLDAMQMELVRLRSK